MVNIWRGLPFFAITILAGLVAIPKELYEAAEADGAGAGARASGTSRCRCSSRCSAVVVLFSTIFTFSDFNIVYVLTHGGPINSTHLFATLVRAGRARDRADRRGRGDLALPLPACSCSWSGRSCASCGSRRTDDGERGGRRAGGKIG